MATIPHLPIDSIPAPTDPDAAYPSMTSISQADSVGPSAANRQPAALDSRTEELRAKVNQTIDVVNALMENLLHRDGVDADPASSMLGNLDMKDASTAVSFKVVNVADGTAPADAVTKSQLDAQKAYLDTLIVDAQSYLPRDGGLPMTGPLNVDGFKVVNIADPTALSDGVSKSYFDGLYTTLEANYLKRDGTLTMTGSLDMGGFKVTNYLDALPTLPSDPVTLQYLVNLVDGASAIPPGVVMPYATDGSGGGTEVTSGQQVITKDLGVPAGWLLCDGQEVSRDTYSTLFATIGTTYGVGDGSTTFNVPDMRGRIPVGLDNMGGTSANVITDPQADVLGGTFGSETVALSINEMPEHTHEYEDAYVSSLSGGSEDGPSTSASTQQAQSLSRTTDTTGGGNPHDNVQPVMSTRYIIKY